MSIPGGGPTIAFVNNRLSLPPGMTWSDIVSEWYVPMIRNLHTSRVVSRHDRHDRSASRIAITTKTSIILNYGLHANINNPDDANEVRGATDKLAAEFTNVATNFLDHLNGEAEQKAPSSSTPPATTSSSRDEPLQLLVLETPPQHFATPTGQYVSSCPPSIHGSSTQVACSPGMVPCVMIAQPSHPACNWRNDAMRRGVERALGAWRTLHGPDDKVGAVRIVPVWRALSEMSGVDCHARHAYNPLLTKLSAARGGPIRGDAPAPLVHHDDHVDERLATKPGGYDCTHLSPDALLFVTQALFHALLDAPAGRRGRRWRAGV